LDELVATSIKIIFHEYKDIFAWNYTDLKGIPPDIAQHCIELNITIPPSHRVRYRMNPNYVAIIKKDLNKFLSVGFIAPMEEVSLLWYQKRLENFESVWISNDSILQLKRGFGRSHRS
jgi:hypothetical protein